MELQGLSFRPGEGVQGTVFRKFGSTVSPVSSSAAFFLVATFGRCKFKLSPSNVALLLQASIGGVADSFDVVPLSDRVFRFSVGFHVFKLRSFSCASYQVFFHLWSNGGPRWKSEWQAFCEEEEQSWSKVQSNARASSGFIKQHRSFADAVKANPLTGANATPIRDASQRTSVFDRMVFPAAYNSFVSKGKEKAPDGTHDHPDFAKLAKSKSQNFDRFSNQGQREEGQSSGSSRKSGFCSRCLSEGHSTWACKSPIRCYACKRGGHISANCRSQSSVIGKNPSVTAPFNGKGILEQPSRNVLEPAKTVGPSPPIFESFSAWAASSQSPGWRSSQMQPKIIEWIIKPNSLTSGVNSSQAHFPATDLSLGNVVFGQSIALSSRINCTNAAANGAPCSELRKPQPEGHSSDPPSELQVNPSDQMAFQRAHPGPFRPHGMHFEEVANRPLMVRAMAGRGQRQRNEDLAIVTISPLPGNLLHFPTVEEVVRELLEDHMGIPVREVQPCHLG
jgi:hypothetical protein